MRPGSMIILQHKPSSALGSAFIWREARALLRARRSPCYHRFGRGSRPRASLASTPYFESHGTAGSEDSPNRLRGRGALNELVAPVPAMISQIDSR